MISFRQADLLRSLKDVPVKFKANFRYENNKVELVGAIPESNEYNESVFEKRDFLEKTIRDVTGVMGFYEDTKSKVWTYNTHQPNAPETVLGVATRLRTYGDERIVSVRDSIAQNISADRFSIEVTVR